MWNPDVVKNWIKLHTKTFFSIDEVEYKVSKALEVNERHEIDKIVDRTRHYFHIIFLSKDGYHHEFIIKGCQPGLEDVIFYDSSDAEEEDKENKENENKENMCP